MRYRDEPPEKPFPYAYMDRALRHTVWAKNLREAT